MDGLAHGLVAAETEAHIAHTAAGERTGQVLLDPAHGLDEVDGVAVVLGHAGGHGEDVRVDDDVVRREAGLLREQVVAALGDGDAALEGVGLALLVEAHHHGGGTEATDDPGLPQELGLPLLQTDAVGDALALQALQARLDHAELAAVHHHRHTRDVGLGGDEVEELAHGLHAIDHALIEVHVDHLRAVLHLLAGHAHGLIVLAVLDQLAEGRAARDVRALADVDEVGTREDAEGFEAGVGGDHVDQMIRRSDNGMTSITREQGEGVVHVSLPQPPAPRYDPASFHNTRPPRSPSRWP